jgi:predicted dehydrogenase
MAVLSSHPKPPGERVRLGIIGCGAIARESHLPAALASPSVDVTILSDPDTRRMQSLRRGFGLDVRCCASFEESFGLVDAVVLALPNHLHAPIGCEFLSRGIHVLCEKPLAISVSECERMCTAATASGAVLAVGYVTRFYPSTVLTRSLIDAGFLGKISSLDYEFGTRGGWAPLSGYNISRSTSGGGVLVISGSHFLDRMLYLFGEPRLVGYADDSRGGVEANCVAEFEWDEGGSGFPGTVTLSKTHALGNRLRVVGERGTLIVGDGQKHSATFLPAGGEFRHEISPADATPLSSEKEYYWRVELEDFVTAIRTGGKPKVDGTDGLRSVRLIETCYRHAERIEEPWVDSTLDRLTAALTRLEATVTAAC